MFSKILLATDGSECALKAAAIAATLARKFGARLTLLSVCEPYPSIGPYGEIVYAGLDDKSAAEMRGHALALTGRVVDAQNAAYECRQEIGQPVAEIVRVAAEEGCDLVVLGSRGLSGFKSLLLGSVSDGVTHHAHCPVLIVK